MGITVATNPIDGSRWWFEVVVRNDRIVRLIPILSTHRRANDYSPLHPLPRLFPIPDQIYNRCTSISLVCISFKINILECRGE